MVERDSVEQMPLQLRAEFLGRLKRVVEATASRDLSELYDLLAGEYREGLGKSDWMKKVKWHAPGRLLSFRLVGVEKVQKYRRGTNRLAHGEWWSVRGWARYDAGELPVRAQFLAEQKKDAWYFSPLGEIEELLE